MRSSRIHDDPRTFVMVFEAGDTVADEVTGLARHEGLTAASVVGIGAFEAAELAYFDWEAKRYDRLRLDEQLEVLSLVGNIARRDGEPAFHAHATLGRRDGTVRGGHLMDGTVRPTLELVVTESPGHLARAMDDATGLPLIDPGRSSPA